MTFKLVEGSNLHPSELKKLIQGSLMSSKSGKRSKFNIV